MNQLYRAVAGRTLKSREYRAWERLVDSYAILVPRTRLQGNVRAVYAMGRPSARRMDVANREKGISDALQRWGVLEDDSQLVDVRLLWSADVEPGMVRVELEEI